MCISTKDFEILWKVLEFHAIWTLVHEKATKNKRTGVHFPACDALG